MPRTLWMLIWPLAVGLVFTPAALVAQDRPGTISGVVRDSTGGVLPGATTRAVNEATRAASEAVTDAQGAYQFAGLPAGRYRVEVTLDGFEFAALQRNVAAGEAATLDVDLAPARFTEGVVVTARRVEEIAQEVPIPVSVLDGRLIEDAGAFNVNRLRELIPTVQFYSTNPRNTSLNIRGLGTTLGLTNDGIEPGVGLYVDGVYFARPAATTLDFIDVERIEVLRGPQGTLFGKNTTAGAISITTRKPTFTRESDFELNYGNYGFVQAKGSISGPLTRTIAARASFSGTQRDGLLYNVASQDDVNDLNNIGVRGQVLITPSETLALTFAADNTRQRPEGYAQVIAGVAPTLRAPARQWPQIAADLGYSLPSNNPFDRVIDTDTPWRSNQSLGGVSLNADWKIGRGTWTSTTAWRYWDWDPSNDRDWTGLAAVSLSRAPSLQKQWTQEVRYAGNVARNLSLVAGFFTFGQNLQSNPFHTTEAGADAWRYSLTPGPLTTTPGLVDGYGENTRLKLDTSSSAVFGQLEWKLNDRIRLLPGARLNYDRKDMHFDRQVYGGLQTTDPALIALQRSIFAPQAYVVDVDDVNTSGQLTGAFKISRAINAYATYATSCKSVGLNLGGVP
ncbi:MAG: TonB-dependent receptor, partial [Vicinamibacterales bacterium]